MDVCCWCSDWHNKRETMKIYAQTKLHYSLKVELSSAFLLVLFSQELKPNSKGKDSSLIWIPCLRACCCKNSDMLRVLWIVCVTSTLTTSTDVKKSQIGKEDVSKNNTKPNEKIQVRFYIFAIIFYPVALLNISLVDLK